MAFGIGLGGFLQGMLEARQRAQQQANLQQQMAQQQAAQQAETDYRNASLRQQGEAEKNQQRRFDVEMAGRQLDQINSILNDKDANLKYSKEQLAGAAAKRDQLYGLYPELGSPIKPEAQQAAQSAAAPPRQPAAPQGPPDQQLSPAQLFGNQASQYQVNPSIGGNIPTPPQSTGHELGPQIPPTLFANPHPAAAPQVAPSAAAPNQPQAPLTQDPIEGINMATSYYRNLMHSPEWANYTPQQKEAVLHDFATLSQAQIAMQHGVLENQGLGIENQYRGPEAKARIGEANAQTGYLTAETLAKPITTQAAYLTARANLAKAQAELDKNNDPNSPDAQKLQLEIQKERERVREWEFEHRTDKNGLTLDQQAQQAQMNETRRHNKVEEGIAINKGEQATGKTNPVALMGLRAKLNAGLKSNLDLMGQLTPAGFQKYSKLVDQLTQQSGANVADLPPPGIDPGAWQYIASGQDPQVLMTTLARNGHPDQAQHVQHAWQMWQKMNPGPRHNSIR